MAAALASVATAAASATGLAAPAHARGEAADGLMIDGRGFGHGVGMPQDGAHALGLAGADVGTILETFYPGTSLGQRGGTVRAELLDHPRASVVIAFVSRESG